MSVVTPIRPAAPASDIVQTLRTIADEIESGKHGVITTCLVATGHTTDRPGAPGEVEHQNDFELFAMGPRTDIYTVRGLLLTVATRV